MRQAKPKVLIIDDDRELTTLLAAHLQGAGYDTVVALDPLQGFMFARRESPGLILLDLTMPAGGGLQLLEKLRKATHTQAIPVIVMTASSDPTISGHVMAKGAADFLRKPVAREILLEVVGRLLPVPGTAR